MSPHERLIRICFPALLTAALSVGTNRDTMAQHVIAKKCDACGAAVSLAAQVGQTCPKCGAYWGYQSETYVPGYSQPSYSYRGTAMDRWLLWQLMLQQRQMQLRQERQMLLELRAAAFRKFDERDRRIRERRREKLIAQMDTLRSKDHPQKLAAQYLADGLECEGKGDTKTAASYYKLATQTLPNSVWANTATEALERLEGM